MYCYPFAALRYVTYVILLWKRKKKQKQKDNVPTNTHTCLPEDSHVFARRLVWRSYTSGSLSIKISQSERPAGNILSRYAGPDEPSITSSKASNEQVEQTRRRDTHQTGRISRLETHLSLKNNLEWCPLLISLSSCAKDGDWKFHAASAGISVRNILHINSYSNVYKIRQVNVTKLDTWRKMFAQQYVLFLRSSYLVLISLWKKSKQD